MASYSKRVVAGIATAAGIRLEAFNGFDPAAFRPGGSDAAAAASLDELVAFNRRSAKTHSGIWRDLAVRKRKTEVDAQLGPIVATAKAHGQEAPICARLIALIHDIEEGRRPLAWSTLDALAGAAAPRPAVAR